MVCSGWRYVRPKCKLRIHDPEEPDLLLLVCVARLQKNTLKELLGRGSLILGAIKKAVVARLLSVLKKRLDRRPSEGGGSADP